MDEDMWLLRAHPVTGEIVVVDPCAVAGHEIVVARIEWGATPADRRLMGAAKELLSRLRVLVSEWPDSRARPDFVVAAESLIARIEGRS